MIISSILETTQSWYEKKKGHWLFIICVCFFGWVTRSLTDLIFEKPPEKPNVVAFYQIIQTSHFKEKDTGELDIHYAEDEEAFVGSRHLWGQIFTLYMSPNIALISISF